MNRTKTTIFTPRPKASDGAGRVVTRRGFVLVVVAVGCAGAGATAGRGDTPPARLRLSAVPLVRVTLVSGARSVRFQSAGPITARDEAGRPVRLDDDRTVTVRVDGGVLRVGGAAASRLSLAPQRRHTIAVNGRRYLGTLLLEAGDGGLSVVNRLALEDYLVGVVRVEMGPLKGNEFAALQAQAVASRTFVLRNVRRSGAADLTATLAEQAYRGVLPGDDLARRAVESTRGEVVTYRGALIPAFFHSTCGGVTASPEEVFQSVRPQPYLRPVSDSRPGGGDFCDVSPRYRWTVEWSAQQLESILRGTVPGALGVDGDYVDELRAVNVRRTGRSGRVTEARIDVPAGAIPVYGHALRSVFRTPDDQTLRSSAIEVALRHEAGRLAAVRVSGRGAGHGVGMCQWGAIGRARAGQDYRTIVTTYYPGVSIERVY